jgi:hypothetical protein
LEEQYGGDMEDFIPERAPGATATSNFDVASGYAQNRARAEGGVPSVQYVDMPSTALPRYIVPGHSGPDNIGYALPTNIFRPYDPNMPEEAPGMSRIYRGTWLPNEAPGDPAPVQQMPTAPTAAAPPAQARADIRYNPRALMPQALERAQETAWNYFPNANVVAGSPHNITGQDIEGQRTEFSMVSPRTGETMLTRAQVNTARDLAGNILNRSVGALTGTTAGRDDPDKMVANYKKEAQRGINDWFKGKLDALKQAFEDDPQGLAQAKQTAQNTRNMLYRSVNAAVKAVADEIGGGNFRDFAGAQRVESVEELRAIAAANPAIAEEIRMTGGTIGGFVAGGGGYLGGGGSQAYVYGDQWGGGGGGGGGGRRGGGMWGGSMGAAMYGMYIGQRMWGYTGGQVLTQGQEYAAFMGAMARPGASMAGPAGFGARQEAIDMQFGQAAYPYAAAVQGLQMMAGDQAGLIQGLKFGGGIAALTHVGGQMAGSGALGTALSGAAAPIAAITGVLGLTAGIGNISGIAEGSWGRQWDMLDPLRGAAAIGVSALSSTFREDPKRWIRENEGLARFIISAEDLRTPKEQFLQEQGVSMAEQFAGVTGEQAIATLSGLGRSGMFAGMEYDERGTQQRRALADQYFQRAEDMGIIGPERFEFQAGIASLYGAPGTDIYQRQFQRLGYVSTLEQFEREQVTGERFAGAMGTVQPYSNISRTRMEEMQLQYREPARFQRYAQGVAQFGQMGFAWEDLLGQIPAGMDPFMAQGFMGAVGEIAPFLQDIPQLDRFNAIQNIGAAYSQLSPDQQFLFGRMSSGNLNAFNFAGLTGQFGIGAEFVSRDIANAPIYQTDLQGFMDWGTAQAGLGINPEANRLFGGGLNQRGMFGRLGIGVAGQSVPTTTKSIITAQCYDGSIWRYVHAARCD